MSFGQPHQRLQLQRVEVADPAGAQVLDAQPPAVRLVVDADGDLGELVADDIGTDLHQTRNASVAIARALSTSATFL